MRDKPLFKGIVILIVILIVGGCLLGILQIEVLKELVVKIIESLTGRSDQPDVRDLLALDYMLKNGIKSFIMGPEFMINSVGSNPNLILFIARMHRPALCFIGQSVLNYYLQSGTPMPFSNITLHPVLAAEDFNQYEECAAKAIIFHFGNQ